MSRERAHHPEDPAPELLSWWRACLARPDQLPSGVAPVQGRLVRSVGVATLADGRRAFLKLMAFPRFKDRLRYALRALPALHEAALLEVVRRLGIPAPRPLFARGARRGLVPQLSLLVTEALPVRESPVPLPAIAALAADLAAAGIEHPDLNPGNFVSLEDGRVAVLDLQSARLRKGPLSRAARLRVAAKLLGGVGAEQANAETLCSSGLLPAGTCPSTLLRAALETTRAQVVKRIARCLHESSEFTREIGFAGVLHRRRASPCDASGTWIHGGRELLRYWIGDRTLEVLDGRPPSLGALFRNSCWLLQRGRLYIPGPSGHAVLRDQIQALEQGYARFREMKRSALRLDGAAPWTTAVASTFGPPDSRKPTSRS